ncbi:MAG: mannose-1-phosphate guanylyltransferase [Candidatus Cloacimonas sp. SDB]|nr:MAG: mannose-1-phosphate guanylyltransferase [Candidatus Cloacimonas sp. SDB]
MIALIMAGGVGTRFWPLSRESRPKQFLNILADKSMIRLTVDRLLAKIKIEDIYVVTAASQVELTSKALPELPAENIIIEPFGRNTAPCIALSCLYLLKKYDKNETMIVLPADHLIEKEEVFLAMLTSANDYALKGDLVTFGIEPRYPATGYGYIEAGKKITSEVYEVVKFKEKPDLATAEKFLEAGNFFWNSGMFMWKLSTILQAFEKYLPEIIAVLASISVKWDSLGIEADISEIYAKMPRLPIDIGVMEKAEKRTVLKVDLGWSDVGSWKALYEISEKDDAGNVIRNHHVTIDSLNNYVHSSKSITLIGVENLVVVDTEDALLIASRERAEEVKEIVEQLKKENSKLV